MRRLQLLPCLILSPSCSSLPPVPRSPGLDFALQQGSQAGLQGSGGAAAPSCLPRVCPATGQSPALPPHTHTYLQFPGSHFQDPSSSQDRHLLTSSFGNPSFYQMLFFPEPTRLSSPGLHSLHTKAQCWFMAPH